MKIIIDTGYGFFNPSHKAVMLYADGIGMTLYSNKDKITGEQSYYKVPMKVLKTMAPEDTIGIEFHSYSIKRDDPILVKIVEALGYEANGPMSHLEVVDIPDDVDWEITEDENGIERVEEVHRVWYGA